MPPIKPIILHAVIFGLYVGAASFVASAIIDALASVFGISFLRNDPVLMAPGGFVFGFVFGVVMKFFSKPKGGPSSPDRV